MQNEVPDVPKSPRKPGDLVLDRVMPNATDQEREAARENLREFAKVIVGIAERIMHEQQNTTRYTTGVIVQIYEVSSPEEGKKLADLGVDHVGVLVGPGTFPRELSCEQARAIFQALPAETKKVALSLSAEPNEICRVIRETKPDIIHIGAAIELVSPEQTQMIKTTFPEVGVMRAIPVTGEESIGWARDYEGIADWLLLDSHRKGDNQIGALGVTHDWSVSARIVASTRIPVILAGGLGPDNVTEAIRKVHPYGVD